MDTLFPTILILSIVVLLLCIMAPVLVIILTRGSARLPPSTTQAKPSRLTSFDVPLPPDETMKIIIRFAQQADSQQAGYQVCAIDPEHNFLALGTPLTFPGGGFFYPIYLSPRGDHSTRVEVGIISKGMYWGAIVNRHHERCAAGIRAAIFAAQP